MDDRPPLEIIRASRDRAARNLKWFLIATAFGGGLSGVMKLVFDCKLVVPEKA